ncbi:hypothetical protein ACRE_035840 [Hapsidospora chrysogenum ATCC 11550]|uniref:Uncharacterized protein n=1 Tax=Hapsidospora chrysogenum (strain ATCC 11550 / CBS 779.69 / DSM 880 / IAM 14645 / JCM 23072 / IMI 49137) TaxID=857340 RepID=A0A086T886_HAPC1|nr:hypothetical protein ACRE_035840 [Hapsidospora chrysogenum ATCC 11550]
MRWNANLCRKHRPRSLMGIFGMKLPSSPASEGISLMLNSETPQERDELTRSWRDHKLEELNFVGTLGALLASCLSSTSAWPDVLNNGHKKPWSVRAIWFSGLVFALFSVIIAGLQSMRLHRLSAHRDGLRKIRVGLGRRHSASSDGYQPYRFQVYAWEASQAFLLLSVVLMVLGIAVLVWVSTEYGPDKPYEDGWWDENSKVSLVMLLLQTCC